VRRLELFCCNLRVPNKIAWKSVRHLERFCGNLRRSLRPSDAKGPELESICNGRVARPRAPLPGKRLFRCPLHRRYLTLSALNYLTLSALNYLTLSALNLIQVKNATNGATLRRLLPPTECSSIALFTTPQLHFHVEWFRLFFEPRRCVIFILGWDL
jgi:hypothetical protein